MTNETYRVLVKAPSLTIRREDIAGILQVLARQFYDHELVCSHDLDIPETADPEQTESEITGLLENALWAALGEHVNEGRYWGSSLQETFENHNALAAAIRVAREDRQLATTD